jgi:hypothetical protein
LRSRPHRVGFPCSGRSPCHACRRHYPGGTAWLLSLGLSRQRRPSPLCDRVGSHIILFEACSAFTHVTACMRAESPMRPFDIGVLQRDSLPPLTAPTASGWSDTCRVGLSPTGDRRLCTAHRIGGMSWRIDIMQRFDPLFGRTAARTRAASTAAGQRINRVELNRVSRTGAGYGDCKGWWGSAHAPR